jgi:hypothetical protein
VDRACTSASRTSSSYPSSSAQASFKVVQRCKYLANDRYREPWASLSVSPRIATRMQPPAISSACCALVPIADGLKICYSCAPENAAAGATRSQSTGTSRPNCFRASILFSPREQGDSDWCETPTVTKAYHPLAPSGQGWLVFAEAGAHVYII